MDVVLPPHLHHGCALGPQSWVLWYYEEPMSDLPSRPWEGNHSSALLALPRGHPVSKSPCPCSREPLQQS